MLVNSCPGCESCEFNLIDKKGTPIYLVVDNKTFCQPEYQVKHCINCGLYYKSHVIDESELADYYPKADFLRYEYDDLFPTEDIILKSLLELSKGSRILDFGCSTGRLLSRLVNEYECCGIEVNVAARQIAESKGIKLIDETDILGSDGLKFDAILLSDVFEHLSHPTELLTKLCQALKPNGSLLICTGNADAPACQKDIANFWYFRSIEHICMFSHKHALFLANLLDFELTSWQEISHYNFTVYDLIRQQIQSFTYWQFHGENKFSFKLILRLVPILKKAEKWNSPPAFTCSQDHVLATFQQKMMS
jgi:2-polyprenyl-3-methyl-5-hydroxy-6-metoxy-1,4-benzoquinol methylase